MNSLGRTTKQKTAARVSRSSTRPGYSSTQVADIKRFVRLLDRNASEQAIHRFLATHIHFWNGLLRLVGEGGPLYSKIRLGADYEVDFVFVDTGSNGAEWHLVEIEPPHFRLFNARGDPSRELTHSLAQVRAYQRWIERNRAFADSFMPGVDHPMGHVFLGRRAELGDEKARERLRTLNIQNRAHVEIHTLDRFARMAESAVGINEVLVPPVALTDRDLRRGLPKGLLRFIRSGFGSQREFIAARRHRSHFDEDVPDASEPSDVIEIVVEDVAGSKPEVNKTQRRRGRSR